MDKLRGWLIRQRDRTFVSYSRFGKPGDEEDDRPPPTTITVAPFNAEAPEYLFMRYWHVQKASVTFAFFGMSISIAIFLSGFFDLSWYHHERGVDIGALFAMLICLALGILIHNGVIFGVRKQVHYFLLPFIFSYSGMITIEIIFCVTVIYKMIVNPEKLVREEFLTMNGWRFLVVLMIVTIAVQTIMLNTVIKCREFISLKVDHDMELKVAEKSREKNPSIQIVIANSGNAIRSADNINFNDSNGSVVNGSVALNANGVSNA